ncbi:hypothetical protein IJ732_01010 [bacterium]|nr:hypothetical protein [bacterium]
MAKVSGIDKFFKSKSVLKTVKFAADNPALFASATTFGLSAIVRPAVILATPKTDKDDKKFAVAKSLTSSAIGLGLSYAVSKPIEKAVKTIDKSPQKFLTPETIKNLGNDAKDLLKSDKYLFATQFFKTAVGLVCAFPKSAMTCAILPLVAKSFDKKDNTISFAGKNKNLIARGISGLMNTKLMQNFADKFSKTNLVQNIAVATDILLTASFVNRVKKSDKIPDTNKRTLINNSIFSTGLSILASMGLNRVSDKPTEKFIKYFLDLNKGLNNPEKYAQGIRAMKTVFVMGGVYYTIIPFISTLLSGIVKSDFKNGQTL